MCARIGSEARRHLLVAVGLCLLTLAVYSNSFGGGFVMDTTLSYLFNYAVLGNGGHPTGYHWINFLLHAANVLLVYALGLRLAGGWRPAAWIAAIWRRWAYLGILSGTTAPLQYLTKVLFILNIRLADRYGSVYAILSICHCRCIDARCLRIRWR